MHQIVEHFEETRRKRNRTIIVGKSGVTSLEDRDNDAPFPHSGNNTP